MYTVWIYRTIFRLCHVRWLFKTRANYVGQLVWQQGHHVLLGKHNANSTLFQVLKQKDWLTKRKREIQEEKSLQDTKWCLEKCNSQNSLFPQYSLASSNKLKISSVYLILQIHSSKNFLGLLFCFFSGSTCKTLVTQVQYRHTTSEKLNNMPNFGTLFKVTFLWKMYFLWMHFLWKILQYYE